MLYEEIDYEEEQWEAEPYEEIRELLAAKYRDLPAEEIEALLWEEGISAEDLEFFGKALRSIGRVAAKALPVVGTVVGTAYGGPVGAMIGGAAGRLAGGAIGAASRRRPRRRPQRRPSRRRVNSYRSRGRRRPLRRYRRPATTGLMRAFANPSVQQGLMSGMLGSLGRTSVPIAGTNVPVGAITNMIGSLANRASAELDVEGHMPEGEEALHYLMDEDGEFLIDPAVPEQRADLLMELIMLDEMEATVEYDDQDMVEDLYEVVAELAEMYESGLEDY